MTDYSYIGAGKVYMRVAGAEAPLLAIGNVSALSLAIAEETKELRDSTQAGGGVYNSVTRISSVDATFSVHDYSPENLAKATFGGLTVVSAGAVTDEVKTLFKGGLIPSAFPIDASVTPTLALDATPATRVDEAVKAQGDLIVPATPNGLYYEVTTAGTLHTSPPTFPTTVGGTVSDGTATLTCRGKVSLVYNTDFTLSGRGVVIADNASITDGTDYKLGYTKKASVLVDALTASAQEYELVFEGVNEARSGKAHSMHIFRLKLGPTQGLGLITEDHGVLEFTGKVLKESSKVGDGVSQYLQQAVVS